MKKLAFVMFLALSACFGASPSYRDTAKDFTMVSEWDAQSYLGKWYEIARYPIIWEENCYAATAEYSLINDKEIKVDNRCRRGSVDGELVQSLGKARVEKPGVLTVTFIPAYPSDPNYYVMGLKGEKGNYQIAVVGEPNGKSGWILARDPQISDEDYAWAKGVFEKNGYDLSPLIKEEQVSK